MGTKFDSRVLHKHTQLSESSCVPAAVELVLKLEGFMKVERHDLQARHFGNKKLEPPEVDGFTTVDGLLKHEKLKNKKDKLPFPMTSGAKQQGRVVTFKCHSGIPCDMSRLKKLAVRELRAGRYLIAGTVEPNGIRHAWTLIGQLGDDFLAVSHGGNCGGVVFISDLWRSRVQPQGGAYLITYQG